MEFVTNLGSTTVAVALGTAPLKLKVEKVLVASKRKRKEGKEEDFLLFIG